MYDEEYAMPEPVDEDWAYEKERQRKIDEDFMSNKNDVTGDKIVTKGVLSEQGRENFDRIFGKKEKKTCDECVRDCGEEETFSCSQGERDRFKQKG